RRGEEVVEDEAVECLDQVEHHPVLPLKHLVDHSHRMPDRELSRELLEPLVRRTHVRYTSVSWSWGPSPLPSRGCLFLRSGLRWWICAGWATCSRPSAWRPWAPTKPPGSTRSTGTARWRRGCEPRPTAT